VADGDYGLQVIYVSNPQSPTLKGSYNTPGLALGVFVLGDYVNVADKGSGLQVIDVSNQVTPLPMANINISYISGGIYINNDYLYIASGHDGLQILSWPCFFLAQVKEVNPEGTEIKAMIPSGLAKGFYTIRVINIDGETDWISNCFEISGPNPFIRVLYPNGNEILRGTIKIQWWSYEDSNSPDEITIDIDYSPDYGQTWDSIAIAEENDGFFEWDTNSISDGGNYLIKLIYKVSGKTMGEDISDGAFSIANINTQPQIKDITASQKADGIVTIDYLCLDKEQTIVDISFQYWNGTEWQPCYTLTGEGMQQTDVPLTASWLARDDFPQQYLTDCQIRIMADDGQAIDPLSRAESPPFILDTKAPVTAIDPNGGTYDSPRTVTLSASDDSDIAAIYYTTDGSDPTIESTVYTNPITIRDNTTLRFFGIDSRGNQELIRTEGFIIRKKVTVSVPDSTCAGGSMTITYQVQYEDGNVVDSDTTRFTISVVGSATFDPNAIEGEVIGINDIYNRALVRTSGGRVIMIIRDDVAEDVLLSFEDTEGLGLEFPAYDYDVTTSKQDIDSSSNTFTFTSTPLPLEDGTLTVYSQGDLDDYSEYFTLYAESASGTYLGDVFRYGGIECGSQITDSITISQSNLHNIALDGIITIIAKKSYEVGFFCDKNTISLNLKYKSFGSRPRFLDPNLDEDNDGLLNGLECNSCMDVNDPDTDGDGMPDGYEFIRDLDPCDNGFTDPNNGPDGDVDSDGIYNLAEYRWGTEPCLVDTDGDGIPDGEEWGPDPNDPMDNDGDGIINPLDLDSDNDGLSDYEEYFKVGTDFTNTDTDEDGWQDEFEVGPDPNHPTLCDCNGVLCPCALDPNNNLMEYCLHNDPNKFFCDLTLHYEENIQWQNGYYRMNGDIRIENGKGLTIGEGVILKFSQGDSLLDLEGGTHELVDLIIDGKLVIQGDPNDMVRLTSTGEPPCIFSDNMENGADKWDYDGFYLDDIEICSVSFPSPGDWGSLILTSSSDPNSTIQHAIIEYGKIGISDLNSSCKIGFNQIRNNLKAGIRLHESNAIVKNNLITHNGKGISLLLSDARIINNTLYGNGNGDYADPNHTQIICHDSSPWIINNIISNGGIGLAIMGSSRPKVSYNDFYQPESYWNFNQNSEFDSAVIDPNLDPVPGGSQIYKDPMFQDANQNNYHLQCASPCIDAGDPNSDYSQEPNPNGGRINMGAYGAMAFH
jgi:parallel beta-helix repeat protein